MHINKNVRNTMAEKQKEVPNVKMNRVKSSAAESCGFDPESGALAVKFRSGGTYYFRSTQEEYDALMGADSFGKHWHSIKSGLKQFNEEEK